MIRLLDPQIARNLRDSKNIAIVVPTNASTQVVPDTTATPEEYAFIEIFNAGVNNAYYAFGRTCDNVENFNAWIVPGQMLEVYTREKVNVFSVGGTTISVTMLKRIDMIQNMHTPA